MVDSVSCREFDYGSPEYLAAVDLREEVLRKPLGMTWQAHDFRGEEVSMHLGAFDGDVLVGTLILLPLDDKTVKMRQVAVSLRRQGQGVGSVLVRFAEQLACQRGFTAMVAHARCAVLGFYQRLGYRVEGEPLVEVGLPHAKIRKQLIGA